MQPRSETTACRYCGRVQDHQCRNTRDMEDVGDVRCLIALRAAGGGERSQEWLARREQEATGAQ